MFRNAAIDSLVSRLSDIDLAQGLTESQRREILDRMREMESQGYDLVKADGTMELLVREALHPGARPYEVTGFEVTTRMAGPDETSSRAAVSVRVNDAILAHESNCTGPIEALDRALRGCLAYLYPELLKVKLTDYLVHILDPSRGVASKAAVFIEWSSGDRIWRTNGVSDNIIEASWRALTASVTLELLRLGERDESVYGIIDDSWAV